MRKEVKKICLYCSAEFTFLAGSKKEFTMRKFCSYECNGNYYAKKFSEERIGEGNPMFGKKPWNYKGGTITKSGSRKIKYIHEWINGKQIKKHRRIMEEHIGRMLEHNEVVHHIDGNGLNNSIENLQVMSRKEHQALHRKGGGAQ